jgi:hypothetical protein
MVVDLTRLRTMPSSATEASVSAKAFTEFHTTRASSGTEPQTEIRLTTEPAPKTS